MNTRAPKHSSDASAATPPVLPAAAPQWLQHPVVHVAKAGAKLVEIERGLRVEHEHIMPSAFMFQYGCSSAGAASLLKPSAANIIF
jgi:hypothetical protein